MAWTLAPSLDQLRSEVNRRWPNRSKSSDGTIGDRAHSARKSEHNPDGLGIVRAIDITARGIDVQQLLDATIGDPRVHYVIHNRKIWSRANGWKARNYTGSNPHTAHVHVSIRNNTSESAGAAARAAAASDRSPWLVKGAAGDAVTVPPKPEQPKPEPKPEPKEDDVPTVIEKIIDFHHNGDNWQTHRDDKGQVIPFHIAEGPIKAMTLTAVVHGPEGHRLGTRWGAWVPGRNGKPGFWSHSIDTAHSTARAETTHNGFTVDPGVQLTFDVWTTEPGDHRIVVTGLVWE